MRGLQIMLMGIMAMQNGTNHTLDVRPAELNGELDVEKLHLSLADENLRNIAKKSVPAEIKVTSWQDMPYSGLTQNKNGTWTGKGYAFAVLDMLKEKLNFTYTIIPPEVMVIGDDKTGMIGQLYKKEVDIAAAFIPTIASLTKFSSFGAILDDAEISFLMKRPSESATGQGILAPFNKKVWWCILITWITVSPIMYFLIAVRTKFSRRGSSEKYSLLTCVWFTYGALLKQGTSSEPKTNSTRLLFATWWIFITILTSFYTANLTAFLTLCEFTLPYNSADDIGAKNPKWFAMKHKTLYEALNKGQFDILNRLKVSMTRNGQFIIDSNATRGLVDMGKMFIGDRDYISKFIAEDYLVKTRDGMIEEGRCKYVMHPKNIFIVRRAFAFQRESSLQEVINKHLMHMVETGAVQHMKVENSPPATYCPLDLKSKERRLRNTDLSLMYKAMAVGFTIAAIFFFGEIIYNYIFRKSFCKCCRGSGTPDKKLEHILPIHSIDPENWWKDSSGYLEELHRQNKVEKNVINGREYWVITEEDGDRRLIPIRTPSALLFQYTN